MSRSASASSAARRRAPSAATALPVLAALVLAAAGPAAAATTTTGTPSTYLASSYGAVCDGAMHLSPVGRSVDETAIQHAINLAEANPAGGTVLLPAGHCILGAALNVSTGHAITLEGAVSTGGSLLTTVTDTVNPALAAGDLDVLDSGNTVQDLVLDQSSYGSAAYVRGDHNTLQNMRILGGASDFALSVVGSGSNGPYSVGNRLMDSQVVSLVDRTVYGAGPACDDGIEWGHQDMSLIRNVTFTGTRLALFQDTNSQVNGYTYYPGPQSCGLNGYEITQPSSNITLSNLTLFGSGGTIGNPSPFPGVVSNVTINNETVEPPVAGAGYALNGRIRGLVLRDVAGVTVDASSLNSGAANSQIDFSPGGSATGVVVEQTTVSQVDFVSGTTNGASFVDDTFEPHTTATGPQTQTFVATKAASAGLSISGGTWFNQAGGLSSGPVTTEQVTGLGGY